MTVPIRAVKWTARWMMRIERLFAPQMPTDAGVADILARLARHPHLARQMALAALAWPIAALLAGVALWGVANMMLGDDSLTFALRIGRTRQVVILGSLLLTIVALAGAAFRLRQTWHEFHHDRVRQTYRLASDAARDGFYMLRYRPPVRSADADFTIEECNEQAAAFLGLTRATLLGKYISALDGTGTIHLSLPVLLQAMTQTVLEDEFRVSPFGQLHATWIQRRVVRVEDGLAVTLCDITAARAHQQALARMANADALTKLPNRHWLNGFLPAALERAHARGNLVGLLVIDLDDFKNINDTLGHAAGDELLQAAAFRLRSAIRPDYPVVRLGGDEFTVVLEQIESADEARRIAARLIETLVDPFVIGNGCVHKVQASIGISLYPQDGLESEVLLKHADIALYAAKENGKAHFLCYQPHLSESLLGRLSKEEALREAIACDQFVVFYQPRVNAVTGMLCSMEALIRWRHPEAGIIPPSEFIPLAEETGLIVALGALVVEKACHQLALWKAAGLPLIPVSINVSTRQFLDSDVQTLFRTAMQRHCLAPELLEIELTESCMMGDDDLVIREMRALQALGIKLLVDDFGTGYSSLSQLQRMNFDVLKVDMAFTSALGKSKESTVFFKAIVWMAHALGMQVVAEGVETAEQLAILQSLACDEIQGYLISRPVAAETMAGFMQQPMLFNAGETTPGQARQSQPKAVPVQTATTEVTPVATSAWPRHQEPAAVPQS
jgi:diguanylate cyclase (GGDEF)-like protein